MFGSMDKRKLFNHVFIPSVILKSIFSVLIQLEKLKEYMLTTNMFF